MHKAALPSPDTLDKLLATWRATDGDAEAGQSLACRRPNGVRVQGRPGQLSQDQVQTVKVEWLRLSKFEHTLAHQVLPNQGAPLKQPVAALIKGNAAIAVSTLSIALAVDGDEMLGTISRIGGPWRP